MYEAFYGLRVKPFSILPDPDFIYWSRPHSLAFAMIEYGIGNHADFTVITGEIGAGKTTLIQHLLNKLPNDISPGFLAVAQCDRGDLLQWIMMAFRQDFEGISSAGLYAKFEEFLVRQQSEGKRTVLIIDEAQNLGAQALEELRLTSNVNALIGELLQIVLIGQPQLKTLLSRPELLQLAQRVSSEFHLTLLNQQDVSASIKHRISVAGVSRALFSDDACDAIGFASRGTPRLINILCDNALMYAFAGGEALVTRDVVEAILEDKRGYGVFSVGQSHCGQAAS